jgi:hypothetical protein
MTHSVLPHAWTWPDDHGRDHMVVAGTKLETDDGRKPAFEALCGRKVPIRELLHRQKFWQCNECLEQLAELISARLDGQAQGATPER